MEWDHFLERRIYRLLLSQKRRGSTNEESKIISAQLHEAGVTRAS